MVSVAPSGEIDGVVVVRPDVHADERGVFVETYRRSWFPEAAEMVQANRADRKQGTIVGLHFHRLQADYWYAPAGRVRAVLHDLRTGSPTESATLALALGPDSGHQGVYIPPGVAHGFAALTDVTLTYLVDRYYDPADELGVAWDDPDIGADWGLGLADPVLSGRDQNNPTRATLAAAGRLPAFPMAWRHR